MNTATTLKELPSQPAAFLNQSDCNSESIDEKQEHQERDAKNYGSNDTCKKQDRFIHLFQ